MSARLTRRALLGSLASVLAALSQAGAAPKPRDRGIGGTGAVPEPTDRGIGGTGVIGTIRRFGSIYVNGLRIAYPADVAVTIDGERADAGSLRLGQVVQVVATHNGAGLTTQNISVSSEVVGPVERRSGDGLIVLGQNVSTRQVEASGWRPGDWVAVSGLRQPNGTIVASLIERRGGGSMRVAGPVRLGAEGEAMIGGLRVGGLEPSFVGQRVLVSGGMADGGFVAQKIALPEQAFLAQVSNVSVESYFARNGSQLHLGSGLVIEDGRAGGHSGHGVVTARVEPNGVLRAQHIAPSPGSGPGNGPGRGGGLQPGGHGFGPSGGPGGGQFGAPNGPNQGFGQGLGNSGHAPGGAAPAGGTNPFSSPAPVPAPLPATPSAPGGFGGAGGFGGGGGFNGPGGMNVPGGLNLPGGLPGLLGPGGGPFRR